MLEVLFDSSEERFRSYDSIVNSYVVDDFFDWPIGGPRSTYSVLKQLRRGGGTFLGTTYSGRCQQPSGARASTLVEGIALQLHV